MQRVIQPIYLAGVVFLVNAFSFGADGFPVRFGGSMSLAHRSLGQKPGEVLIENQLLLSDVFFSIEGPVVQGAPFLLEFRMDEEGRPQLNRFTVSYLDLEPYDFKVGRFLVPFGRINELLHADKYVSITRPLLYASPRLDLITRLNQPNPVFSQGYVDTGVSFGFHLQNQHPVIPSNGELYIVSGFGEAPEDMGRATPSLLVLDTPPPPAGGLDIDFGHQRNSLADNNDNKAIGGRVQWNVGDKHLPGPLPEGLKEIHNLDFGLSFMNGKYDLADQLSYTNIGTDVSCQWGEFALSGEYVYYRRKSRPLDAVTLTTSDNHRTLTEYVRGFYLQSIVPLPEFSFSEQLLLFIRWGQLRRDGLALIKTTKNGAFVAALTDDAPKIHRRHNKYTFGLNARLSPYFTLKGEYSYWDYISETDVSMIAFAGVLGF